MRVLQYTRKAFLQILGCLYLIYAICGPPLDTHCTIELKISLFVYPARVGTEIGHHIEQLDVVIKVFGFHPGDKPTDRIITT